ncbi:Major facilitator superfamily [Kalmanozyma brasiliensis GHG001]|uniref:Major facilitator superfamily (MFS) profile domain-containing protein n=1 Tax=Kalmanozyma brasiliensis (strain GHG001) TaxID=1365824 RepID=V5EBW1_KALBG|nr:Major facilitator superfamily [Kalmanozyma brasiliensis GHG001]EST07926.1 Major facilitator superfamily [Kalmanozyma brasiliensis GHG001]
MSSSSTSTVALDSAPHDHRPPLYNAGRLGQARQLLGVAILCLSMLLTQSSLGQTVLPIRSIARTFDVESSDAQQSWFAASFSLTVGTFVLPAGRIGDLVGHKTVVIVGYAVLSVWSLLAGLSHYTGSYVFFDVCRAMQGLGCAVLLPNSLAILGRVFAPGTYAKHLSFSFFAATAPNGFLVGALFTTLMDMNSRLGWQWGFYIMAITAAALAVLCIWILPNEAEMRAVSAAWESDTKPESSEPSTPIEKKAPLWQRIDLFGTLTGIIGLVLFNFAFNQALVVGWQTPYIYALLLVGLLFIGVFIYGESKALFPLLPTSVFHLSGTFILLSLACGWASFGIWLFYVNLMQQTIRGYSPIFTLLTFVPAGVAGIVAAFSSAHILGKTSPPFVMLLSLIAFCTGSCVAGNAPVRVESLPYIASAIMPFGMDMSFPAASIILSDFLPAHQQGTASSIVNTVVNYSIALGLGFAGVVETHVNEGGRNVLKGYRGAFYMGMGFAGAGVALALVNWGMHLRESKQSQRDKDETEAEKF